MTYLRPWELRRKIVQCQMNGMTVREAAAWIGMCPRWLNARRRELGLPRFEVPLEISRKRPEGNFTPDDEALIRCCLDAGCTVAQVATLLQRSRNSIYQKRLRLGLPPFWPGRRRIAKRRGPVMVKRLWQGERLDRLRTLHQAGLSMPDIAARFGTTKNAVIGAIHRHLRPQEACP